MMKKLLFALCFMPFLMASTCEDDDERTDEIICTAEARAGLNVTVKDATTQAELFEGVTVVAIEGDYSETLEPVAGSATFAGAWERSGFYMLRISKEGYETQFSDLIAVNRDQCHVIPRMISISLQPE